MAVSLEPNMYLSLCYRTIWQLWQHQESAETFEMNPKEVKAFVSLTAAHWRPGQAVPQLKCDNWPRKLLGENAFGSRQTTTFLIWSSALLPSKSNHGFKKRLLDQQGVKSYVRLGARVITNSVSEAKCSFRGGGSSSRACVRLACGQEGRAPPHVPQHPAATQHQGQPWGRRKPGALCWVRLEPVLETCLVPQCSSSSSALSSQNSLRHSFIL